MNDAKSNESQANQRQTIVSLTFDDALDAHLDAAIPILDRHGLPGSFYVNVGRSNFLSRHREWGEAARRGHELGNHTIFHPGVLSKSWVTEGIALEKYGVDRMRHELVVANGVLGMVDGRGRRSFAFPCSNPNLGYPGWPRRLLTRLGLDRTRLMGWVDRFGLDIGSRLVDYTPVVRELFPASRCGGIAAHAVPAQIRDVHRVRAIAGDGMDFVQLDAALEEARARGHWLIFVFHGVGGGHHLSVGAEDFERFARRLREDPHIDVRTFIDAADFFRASVQEHA